MTGNRRGVLSDTFVTIDDMTPQTSLTLLEKLIGGDNSFAWDRFVRLYTPLIYRWCRRRGLQPADAHDVSSEVLLCVYRSIEKFQPGSFRGWLKTMTENKVIDFRRKNRKEASLDDSLPAIASHTPNPESAEMRSEEEAMVSENRELYLRAARIVTEDFKNDSYWPAFEQYVLHQRPAAEVALELGISRDLVYKIPKRILTRLRQEFRGLIDSGPMD